MKKIDFAPQISEVFVIDGNDIKVVSIPFIEIKRIYFDEQRLASIVAKKDLELDKEELKAVDFDPQAWAENWCSQNGIEVTDGRYSTAYAKHNSGKKPPQTYYDVRLKEMEGEYLGLSILHHFIRDEKGQMFFDSQKDYEKGTYSVERNVLTDWVLKNEELKMACNYAAGGNLLGFTDWKEAMKKSNELSKEQPIGEINQQLQDTAVME